MDWCGIQGGEIGDLPVHGTVSFLGSSALFDIPFLFSHSFGIRVCGTLL